MPASLTLPAPAMLRIALDKTKDGLEDAFITNINPTLPAHMAIFRRIKEGSKITFDDKKTYIKAGSWFVSFVNEIDPLGEIGTWSGEDSEFLVKDWKHAQ